MKLLLSRFAVTALLATPLPAQNSDLGFLFGASPQQTEIRQNAIQIKLRLAIARRPRWAPVRGDTSSSSSTAPTTKLDRAITGQSDASVYFIPDLRYQHSLTPSVAVCGAAGIGLQARNTHVGLVMKRSVISQKQTCLSLASAGSKKSLGRRNNVNIQFGFALHF